MTDPYSRDNDRASMDATERLRARLSAGIASPLPARPARTVWPWVLSGALFVFLAGLIANPWFESEVRSRLPFSAALPAPDADAAALKLRLAELERRSNGAAAAMPAERLARTEARVESSTDQIARDAERIDALTAQLSALTARVDGEQARTAAIAGTAMAAADRAEGLLTLLMVRRAIEAGRPIGALEASLQRLFAARYPEAVKSVMALGQAPVSRAVLQRDLDRLATALKAGDSATRGQSWWDALTSSVSGLVSGPDARVVGPIESAEAAMARGNVTAAAQALRRLPPAVRRDAAGWLAGAARLAAGEQGLTTLETSTLIALPVLAAQAPARSLAAAPLR